MADPLSITASIVGITAAGVQVSISLFALAETVATASERVSSIANDISSTCGILNQLRDLITPQPGLISAHNTSVFNPTALSDIHSAIHHCRSIFSQIKKQLGRATRQISDVVPRPNQKITLSRTEKAKWPFLQAAVQELRTDLRDSKTNLLLMVAVANLAMAQRRGRVRIFDAEEQADLKATIVKLQRMKTAEVEESDDESEEEKEKENLVKRLMQKLGLRKGGRKEESEDDTDDESVQNDRIPPPAAAGTRKTAMDEESPERSRHPADAAAAITTSAPPHQPNSRASGSDPVNSDGPLEKEKLHEEHPENLNAIGQIDKIESTKSGLMPAQDINTGNKNDVFHVVDAGEIVDSKTKDQIPENDARFVDVAVQTVTEKEVVHNVLPFMTSVRPNTQARVTEFEQASTSKLPERSLLDHPGSMKARGPPESAESSQLEPIHAKQQKASSIGSSDSKEEYLQAWIFSILPGLTMGQGPSVGIMDLSLSELEIRALLQKQEAEQGNPTIMLNQLNTYQRCAVLHHTRRSKSKLLYVNVWRKESIATVFGELEIVTLMWITSSAEKIDSWAEAQLEEQNWNTRMPDLKGKGAVGNVAPPPPEVEEPLYFKDAVGRKFVFPFHLVKAWKGMEELVKQAFLHVDVIGPHVQEGHYDLVDSDGKIILPQTWTHLVKPGWEVVMHMWPMPEPPRPRPHIPPPPPPDAAQFRPFDLPLGKHKPAPPPPPPPVLGGPPPPPAHIYVPPLNHGYLRHSFDGKQNDLSVLKWMAGMAGPGLGKPSFGKKKVKQENYVEPYRVVDKGKTRASKREEDRIVDDLLFKWTG